jgi:glycerophosphoryl diester phosphodiesterase
MLGGCRADTTSPPTSQAIVIAHRGASFDAPEHTVAAYDLALAQHADYLELDIARSSDNVLVVIHDATLDRTMQGISASCGGGVASKTIAQLRTCDAGSWFNSVYPARASASFANLRIQTVGEVFDQYTAGGFYIEIKNPELYPGIEAELVNMLNARGLVGDDAYVLPRIFVQSFSRSSLEKVRSLDPRIALIFLFPDVAGIKDLLPEAAAFADGVGVPVARTDAALVNRAHQLDLLIHPYVTDDESQMLSLLEMGVDGIFSNRPGVLTDVLSRSR